MNALWIFALVAAAVGIAWVFLRSLGPGMEKVGGAIGGVAETVGELTEQDIEAFHGALETSVEFVGDELEQVISDATFHPDDNLEAIQNFMNAKVTGSYWWQRYVLWRDNPNLRNVFPSWIRGVLDEAYASPQKGMQFFYNLSLPMQGRVEWTQTHDWLQDQVQYIAERARE